MTIGLMGLLVAFSLDAAPCARENPEYELQAIDEVFSPVVAEVTLEAVDYSVACVEKATTSFAAETANKWHGSDAMATFEHFSQDTPGHIDPGDLVKCSGELTSFTNQLSFGRIWQAEPDTRSENPGYIETNKANGSLIVQKHPPARSVASR